MYGISRDVTILQVLILSKLCKSNFLICSSTSCYQHVNVYNVVVHKEPLWLFYSEDLYSLNGLSIPVLAEILKSCCGGMLNLCFTKSLYISRIVNHFIAECKLFFPDVTNNTVVDRFSQENICEFIEHMERLYSNLNAALFREPSFSLSNQLVHRPVGADGVLWLHKSIDLLVESLCSSQLSFNMLLTEMKKNPNHCHPLYDSQNFCTTLHFLVIHVLQCILYLLDIDMELMSSVVYSLCPKLTFEHEPTQECLVTTIIQYEYRTAIFESLCVSTDKYECRCIVRKEEKLSRVFLAKDTLMGYEKNWLTRISQRLFA